MNSRHFHLSRLRAGVGILGISVVLTGANLLAQQTAPPGDQAPHAWRRFGQPPGDTPVDQGQAGKAQAATDPAQASPDQAPPDQAQAGAPGFQNGPEAEPSAEPPQAGDPAQAPPPMQRPNMPQRPPMPRSMAPMAPVPAQLTVPSGTLISVRLTEPVSSDHNQPGDGFTAVLQQPLVADGIVVARRGQTILGRVTAAEKAGHVKGLSKLGIELGEMTLVDGHQMPLHTELLEQRGSTSYGRDATAIGATTATGAAIGAAVNGGVGAGVGAAAGLVASVAGVLLTRGHPTVIYPEALLTFRLTAPLTIDTERSAAAFRPVTPQDYNGNGQMRPRYASGPPPSLYGGPGYYAPYYGYGYPYYAAYPGFYGWGWGPSIYFGGGWGYRGRWRR